MDAFQLFCTLILILIAAVVFLILKGLVKKKIKVLPVIVIVASGILIPYVLAVLYAMYGPGRGIGKAVGAWFTAMIIHLIISMVYLGIQLVKAGKKNPDLS